MFVWSNYIWKHNIYLPRWIYLQLNQRPFWKIVTTMQHQWTRISLHSEKITFHITSPPTALGYSFCLPCRTNGSSFPQLPTDRVLRGLSTRRTLLHYFQRFISIPNRIHILNRLSGFKEILFSFVGISIASRWMNSIMNALLLIFGASHCISYKACSMIQQTTFLGYHIAK